MPELIFTSIRRAIWLCVSVALIASAPAARSDTDPDALDDGVRVAIKALDEILRAGPRPEIQAATLIQNSGLSVFTGDVMPTAEVFSSVRGLGLDRVSARTTDFRLTLGQIAQLYGAQDNTVVVEAQSLPGAQALVIDSGTVTVESLFEAARVAGVQEDGGAGYNLLRAPLIIGADATLVLSPGDVLRLSRPDGAFIANFGRIEVIGATIEGVGPTNPNATEFLPFVVNAGGASVVARNSHFRALGFGSEAKFGGFSIVRNPVLVRRDEIVIEGNVFENLNSVAVSLTDNVVIKNNRFRNSRAAALIISRTNNAKVIGNIFFGPLPETYGRLPSASNAVRINFASRNALVSGNLIIHGFRAGVAVRTRSHSVRVENNVIYNRGGAGVTLRDVNCAIIQNNVVVENHQKGVEIRSGSRAVIKGNLLLGNRSPAVYLADQLDDETTLIQENTFVRNGAGLGGATGAVYALVGNNFAKQFPRFVQGDLAHLSNQVIEALGGESPLVLTAGGLMNVPVPNVSCTE